jgi:ribosomal protein S25
MAKKTTEADDIPEATAAPDLTADDSKVDKVEVINISKKINKKYGKVATMELKKRDPWLPRSLEEKLRSELPKSKGITANDLAAKYDVSVSTMRKFLYTLENEGILERVSTSSRLKVFNPK